MCPQCTVRFRREESLAGYSCAGGEEFIVRANRSPSGSHKDAYCCSTVRSAALLIPEIVLIGETGKIWPYCISLRRAAGVTLRRTRRQQRLPGVTAAVAHAMQAIARCATSRYRRASVRSILVVSVNTRTGGISCVPLADPHRYDWSRVNALVSSRWCAGVYEQVAKICLSGCPETRRPVHADFGSQTTSRLMA